MNFSGFDGTDNRTENTNEVNSPAIEGTDCALDAKELEMSKFEPVEIQDEVSEANKNSFEGFIGDMNFDQLELEEPEILEDDNNEDADAIKEISNDASKSTLEFGDGEIENLVGENIELNEVPEEDIDCVSKYEAWDIKEHISEILEQFEAKEETFEAAMDGENSEKFVGNCSETLDRLNEQKAIVESAKDLKFQEIYSYVTENNMDRFDTAHDSYYHHLIIEYKAMQQQDDEIRSHINTIDAQAMSVAYYQELAYESKANDLNRNPLLEQTETDEIKEADGEVREIDEKTAELPPEIAEGIDDPETTDYFVDEVRAKETLEFFANDKWENLELDEKKIAIDKLAEYNQDILGLKEPVKIEYYANDVPGDYGGFDKEKDTLFINENNLQDGPETADTVAHEMRHAYQYIRAEELETNRDLAFAENFARYIRPEQNQSAYEIQIVEKDAALYAQRFKAYAASLNAGSLEEPEEIAEAKSAGDKSLEHHPEEENR